MTRQAPVAQATASDNPENLPTRVVFEGLPERKMNVELRYADAQYGEYAIPLATETEAGRERDWDRRDWENILLPVRLRCFATANLVRHESRFPAPGGYVYVFRDGHLWRELEVRAQGVLRDVNLAMEKGKDVRLATAKADSVLLLPYAFRNVQPEIQICYSHVQWSWARVQALGGLQPNDPRLSADNGIEVTAGEQSPAAAELRRLRMQTITIERSELFGHGATLDDSREDNPDADTSLVTRVQVSGRDMYTYHLVDTVGIALELKQDHQSCVNDLTALAATSDSGEYNLARLIRSLLIAEHAQATGSAATGNPAEEWKRLYTHIRANGSSAQGALASSVSLGRLNDILSGWDTLTDGIEGRLRETGSALAKWIGGAAGERGRRFEVALQDYFYKTLDCDMVGLGLWLYLVDSFDFEEGRAYIARIADEGSAQHLPFLTSPSSELAAYIRRVEDREIVLSVDHPALQVFDSETSFNILGKAATAGSSLLDAFADVKAPLGAEGMEWLAKLGMAITGVQMQVVNKTLSAALQWQGRRRASVPEGVVQRSMTRTEYRALLRELDKVRVPQIEVANLTPERAVERLKASSGYSGFLFAVGVVQMVNFGYAANKYLTESEDQNWNGVAAVAAFSGVVAAFSEFALTLMQARYAAALSATPAAASVASAQAAYATAQPWQRGRAAGELARTRALASTASQLAGTTLTPFMLRAMVRWGGFIAAFGDAALSGRNAVRALGAGNYHAATGAAAGALGSTMIGVGLLGMGGKVAAAGVTAAGGKAAAAGAVSGNVVLVAVGAVIALGGGAYYALSQLTELEKALRHGWFGVRPYADSKPPFAQRPVSEPFAGESLWLRGPLSVVRLDAEFAAIMRALFAYKVELVAGREQLPNKPGSQRIEVSDNVIIRATVEFGSVLPDQTVVRPELTVGERGALKRWIFGGGTAVTAGTCDELLEFDELKEGRVVKRHYLWRAPLSAAADGIGFRIALDVYGDGSITLPADGSKEEVRHTFDWGRQAIAPRLTRREEYERLVGIHQERKVQQAQEELDELPRGAHEQEAADARL